MLEGFNVLAALHLSSSGNTIQAAAKPSLSSIERMLAAPPHRNARPDYLYCLKRMGESSHCVGQLE
jgi:hypothetical protein